MFGNDGYNPPSRFIGEIDEKYLDKEDTNLVYTQKSKVRIDNIDEDINYTIGEKVRHEEFGEGIIITVDKSILTIAFPHPYGIKKMMKGHKSLTKIS